MAKHFRDALDEQAGRKSQESFSTKQVVGFGVLVLAMAWLAQAVGESAPFELESDARIPIIFALLIYAFPGILVGYGAQIVARLFAIRESALAVWIVVAGSIYTVYSGLNSERKGYRIDDQGEMYRVPEHIVVQLGQTPAERGFSIEHQIPGLWEFFSQVFVLPNLLFPVLFLINVLASVAVLRWGLDRVDTK